MAYDRSAIVPLVCARLAQGESLRAICAEKEFPDRMTISDWCQADPETAAAIAHAREVGFDERAERAVEDAQGAKDARLAFDAERWYLSKLNPKRYGERTTIAGDPDAPLSAPADPVQAAITLVSILAAARQRRLADGSDLA